jgi:hypothetical protein
METYRILKVDTRIYIKGLSGPLVFRALYGIIAAFLLFTFLYIFLGVFPSVVICVPAIFFWLYRLNTIQKKLGPEGWSKKRTARALPQFISIKRRICQFSNP